MLANLGMRGGLGGLGDWGKEPGEGDCRDVSNRDLNFIIMRKNIKFAAGGK